MTDLSDTGTRVMSKREKSSRTYQDSLDDDIEILRSTQGSSTPRILQSTVLSMPSNKAMAASSVIRHMYNYGDNSDA